MSQVSPSRVGFVIMPSQRGYSAWVVFTTPNAVRRRLVACCRKLPGGANATVLPIGSASSVILEDYTNLAALQAGINRIIAAVADHLGCEFEVEDQGVYTPEQDGGRDIPYLVLLASHRPVWQLSPGVYIFLKKLSAGCSMVIRIFRRS